MYRKFVVLGLSCLCLSGCAAGKVLDCADLWRFENCFLVDGHYEKKYAARAKEKRSQQVYREYTPPKMNKPSKTWGD